MENSKKTFLTKSEMKAIVGGDGPDQSAKMCEPRECEAPVGFRRCDDSSCPPLEPDPE